MNNYMNARYQNLRKEAIKILGGKCRECGSTLHLEIDHIDPSKKTFPVSKLWSIRKELFLKEIDKCQLLCTKHHQKKTLEDNGFNSRKEHGTLASYRHAKCRCDLCVKANSDYQREYRKRVKLRTVTQVDNET